MIHEDGHVLIATNGIPMRLSPSAYRLLRAVDSGTSFVDLAQAMSERGRAVTATEVKTSYERLSEQLRRVEESPGPEMPPGFFFKWRLLGPSAVNRIASLLAALYSSALVPVLVLGIVLTAALSSPPSSSVLFRLEGFWPAYLLFIASLLVHEIGHSSACVRFGIRPSDIGVAVYLIYPAFYSNVTRAWQLSRWQRVVVDLGGVYFQLIVGAGYALAYRATGWPAFGLAFWMVVASCLASLTPIFRLDGYWVLADALGFSRLDREPGRLLAHLVHRLRGRRDRAWPWRPGTTVVVALYSAVALGAWSCLLGRLVPELLRRASNLPEQALALVRSLALDNALDVGLVHSLVFSTFLLAVSSLMARRMFLRTARWFGQSILNV